MKFGKIKVAVLETGAFFGEAGFLWDPTQGRGPEDQPQPLQQQRPRRWASVYSNTYCDVRYISRAKFEEVLQLCPDVSATEVGHCVRTSFYLGADPTHIYTCIPQSLSIDRRHL